MDQMQSHDISSAPYAFYPPNGGNLGDHDPQQGQFIYHPHQSYIVPSAPVPMVPSHGLHTDRLALLAAQHYPHADQQLHTPPPSDDQHMMYDQGHMQPHQHQHSMHAHAHYDHHAPPPLEAPGLSDTSTDTMHSASRDSSGPASPASARGLSLAIGSHPLRFNPMASPAGSSGSSRGSHSRRRSSPIQLNDDAYSDGDDAPLGMVHGLAIADCLGLSRKEATRRQRIEAEQRRRDELREGYQRLKEVLPSMGQKSSKVALLDRATGHILQLDRVNKALLARLQAAEEEVHRLRHISEAMSISMSRGSTATASSVPSPGEDGTDNGGHMHVELAGSDVGDDQNCSPGTEHAEHVEPKLEAGDHTDPGRPVAQF